MQRHRGIQSAGSLSCLVSSIVYTAIEALDLARGEELVAVSGAIQS